LNIRPIKLEAQDTAVRDLATALAQDLLHLLASSDWIAPLMTSAPGAYDYVLTSVLRVRSDQLRLEVQLEDAQSETVWRDAFDGALSASFDWQDRVGRQIATNVFGAVIDRERTCLLEKPLAELTAEDCLKCAVLEFFEISDDTLVTSLNYVDHAISRDAAFVPAYVQGVRNVLAAIAVGYRNGVRTWLDKLPDWLDEAERSPSDQIRTRLYRGIWDHLEAHAPEVLRDCIDEVLAVAPKDLDALCLGGWAYIWLGDPQRAITCFRQFESRGHFNAMTMAVRAGLATALVQAGRDIEAAEHAKAILRHTREFAVPFRALAAASAHLGDKAQAREAVAEALRLVPGDTLAALKERSGFGDTEAVRRLFDGLAAAGFPE
jgi:tetratricopeptide (TPR) repeat protein